MASLFGSNLFISRHRKLRDEYDKLEGALRRLGVDPEAVVGPRGGGDKSGDIEALEDNGERDLLINEITVQGHRRHLDILEEVRPVLSFVHAYSLSLSVLYPHLHVLDKQEVHGSSSILYIYISNGPLLSCCGTAWMCLFSLLCLAWTLYLCSLFRKGRKLVAEAVGRLSSTSTVSASVFVNLVPLCCCSFL